MNIRHPMSILYSLSIKTIFDPLSANPTKWSNTLKQFIGNLPTMIKWTYDFYIFMWQFVLNFDVDVLLVFCKWILKLLPVAVI